MFLCDYYFLIELKTESLHYLKFLILKYHAVCCLLKQKKHVEIYSKTNLKLKQNEENVQQLLKEQNISAATEISGLKKIYR